MLLHLKINMNIKLISEAGQITIPLQWILWIMSTSKATSLWKKTLWQSSNLPSYNFCHQNSICIPSNLERYPLLSCTFQTNQPNLYLLVWVLFLVLHQTQDAWLYKSVANQQPEQHFKGAHHVDHHVDHHVAHHVDLHVVDHHMDHNVDYHVDHHVGLTWVSAQWGSGCSWRLVIPFKNQTCWFNTGNSHTR